jgi:hypothetical protein
VDAYRQAGEKTPDEAPQKTREQLELEALEAELTAARNAATQKARSIDDGKKLERMRWELGFEKAKLDALGKYMPEQLVEFDVGGIGLCLFHWPDEITHDHFMSKSGALKADLSNVTMDMFENLIGRCAVYPSGAEFLTLARKHNPAARSAVGGRIIAEMRKSIDEKGK